LNGVNRVKVTEIAGPMNRVLAMAEKLNVRSERLLAVAGTGVTVCYQVQTMLEEWSDPGFK
jgi:hypothetical protein